MKKVIENYVDGIEICDNPIRGVSRDVWFFFYRNVFLIKKKKINKDSNILDIGCGRGKIFGSLSRKLKLINRPIGIDPVIHKDVDKSIDFRNDNIFHFFKSNKKKFDLIMISS